MKIILIPANKKFKIIKKIQPIIFLILILIVISSCKEEIKEIVKTIELDSKEFSVNENSQQGTVVGTYTIPNVNSNQNVTYSIISGNKENAFAINQQGQITVNNALALDFEKIISFNLLISATIEDNTKYLANVAINVIDVKPTANNLFAHYMLNGNANDVSGLKNGLPTNVLFMESENNYPNKVAFFNGTSSYINFPNSFDFINRTISVWFNATEMDSDLKVIYTSDNPSLNYGLMVLSVSQQSGTPTLLFNFSNQIQGIEIVKGKWYNAVIKTNGLTYSYFLNGQLVKSSSAPGYISSFNGNSTAILGSLRNLSARFFSGKIDNVRIYNRDLSNQEITEIYKEEIWTE